MLLVLKSAMGVNSFIYNENIRKSQYVLVEMVFGILYTPNKENPTLLVYYTPLLAPLQEHGRIFLPSWVPVICAIFCVPCTNAPDFAQKPRDFCQWHGEKRQKKPRLSGQEHHIGGDTMAAAGNTGAFGDQKLLPFQPQWETSSYLT